LMRAKEGSSACILQTTPLLFSTQSKHDFITNSALSACTKSTSLVFCKILRFYTWLFSKWWEFFLKKMKLSMCSTPSSLLQNCRQNEIYFQHMVVCCYAWLF
jgi:hypothetical protein